MFPDVISSTDTEWLQKLTAGMLATNAGMHGDAVVCMRQALEIAQLQGLSSDQVLHTYLAYGMALRDDDRMEQAQKLLREAVKYAAKHCEAESPVRMYLLAQYGTVLFEREHYFWARPALEKALEIYRQGDFETDPEFLVVFLLLVRCYFYTNHYRSGRAAAKEMYDLFREKIGPNHPVTVDAKQMMEWRFPTGEELRKLLLKPLPGSRKRRGRKGAAAR